MSRSTVGVAGLAGLVATLALVGIVAAIALPGVESVSVSAVSPAPNATGVARDDTVRLDFGMMPMGLATRFTLRVGDAKGPPVPGKMLFSGNRRQLVFVPDSLLRPGTRHFVEVRYGVMKSTSPSSSRIDWGMTGGARRTFAGQMPRDVTRMRGGMGWGFTTGN